MKKRWFLGLISFSLLAMVACGKADWENADDNFTYVCYLNEEESKLVQEKYEISAVGAERKVEELYRRMSKPSKDSDSVTLLPDEVTIKEWKLEKGVLWLDFGKEYAEMHAHSEVLARAGMVRTFTQISEVQAVGFLIDGKELLDSQGEAVGIMNADSFVENSGKQVNAYQYTTLNLYFSSKSGNQLVKEERSIYYSKNTPLERVVVEQLIAGPKDNDNQATIPPETKILGVTAVDGIGYVNLDTAFLNSMLPVQAEIAIQSIVKSLTDASPVGKVQISVNGDTKVEYRESISLDQFFGSKAALYKEEPSE